MAARNQPTITSALLELFRFMSQARRRQFFAVLGLMLVGAFAETAALGSVLPFLSLLADPRHIASLPLIPSLFAAVGAHSSREMLTASALLFAIAATVAAALRLQLAWSSQSFVFQLGHEVAVDIHRRILSQPYTYHIAHNSSDLLASMEKTHVLVFNVLLQIMQSATAVLLSLFIVAALIAIDPFTAIVSILSFAILYAFVSFFFRGRLKANSSVIDAAYQQRIQIIQESLGGIRDIIIDHSKNVFVAAFTNADRRLSAARTSNAFIGAAPRFIIEGAGMVLIAALAIVIAQRDGGLSGALPVLGALALGAQRLLPMLQQIYSGWANIAGHWYVVADVVRMLSLPVKHEEDGAAGVLSFRDEIRLENVGFTYPGRRDPVLHDVSLTIPRGSRVALVGRTGSGKSTLADLLMGLLEPEAGQVSVDGVPLHGGARVKWQGSIAHVPQSIFLADTSIARNIAFGSPEAEVDLGRVVQAAEDAQLHEFVSKLPEGYGTPVGERGIRLSGGQRQRLGIARALYKGAPVVVLDEATSALDDETETAVIHALNELGKQGRTIVMIAHRLTTLAGCDIVAKLDRGRLVEVGSFAEVIGDLPQPRFAD